jgi:glycosyltransferase involved in cell wall biosynthesis
MGDRAPLHVHALIDSLTCGGAELLLAEFAEVAPAAGIELTVGYLQDRAGSPAAERLREAGVEPVLVGIPSHLYPSAFRLVRRHLAAHSPDVLHTHLGYSDLLGGVAARSLGIPMVSTIHAIGRSSGARAYAKSVLMGLAQRACATRVIAVSEEARRSYLESWWEKSDRVVTVHNGTAQAARPGAGPSVREELGLGPDELVLATVSALRPEKGLDVALAATSRLRGRFPALRVLIVGEGPSRAKIERAAAPLGDTVLFTGYRPDVMAVLDAVDVLVHPSRSDAFPTTLLEAMAAGVPAVATAVGGIPEIAEQDVTGLLIEPPPRPEPLAHALGLLLDDPDLRRRLGGSAREQFSRRFAGAGWAERTREVYEAALAAAVRQNGRLPQRRRATARGS